MHNFTARALAFVAAERHAPVVHRAVRADGPRARAAPQGPVMPRRHLLSLQYFGDTYSSTTTAVRVL
jgi:hypothetical protein